MNLIEQLHQEYCDRTGYTLLLSADRTAAWQSWLSYNPQAPFALQDLKDVVAYLRSQIQQDKRQPGALRFRNLIGDPSYFEEDLEAAREWRQSQRGRFGSTKPRAAPAKKEDDQPVSLAELEQMKKDAGL